ncbi:MAG: DUF6103 family protein [Synergistaceae bacterium]|jgi:hypothetical protein|nr:DUF6103 family protein [Synergistaceae bacterium]
MKKVNITLSFDDERMDALEFSLKKENSTVQKRMDDALKELYEKTVPEPVREYLDSRSAPVANEKPKRPAKPAAPKTQFPSTKPSPSAVAPMKEVEKNA